MAYFTMHIRVLGLSELTFDIIPWRHGDLVILCLIQSEYYQYRDPHIKDKTVSRSMRRGSVWFTCRHSHLCRRKARVVWAMSIAIRHLWGVWMQSWSRRLGTTCKGLHEHWNRCCHKYLHERLWLACYLHTGTRDKTVAIFQTTFSNAFSWMKMYEFQLRFHWSLFLRVQLTISSFVQIMAWRRSGDKSEPMMAYFTRI